MKTITFYFAIIGWTTSLIISIISFLTIDITEYFKVELILAIGALIVLIPSVLIIRSKYDGMNPIVLLKLILNGIPVLFKILAILNVIYLGTVILKMSSHQGILQFENGRYFLLINGELDKTLTKSEYHQYKAFNTGVTSVFLMTFYGFAAVVSVPFRKQLIVKTNKSSS